MEKKKFIYLSIILIVVIAVAVFIFLNYGQKFFKKAKVEKGKRTLEQIIKEDLTAPAGTENTKIPENVMKNLSAPKK